MTQDGSNWAKPVDALHISHDVPADALNLNVEGKRVAAMAGGFGKMWQKTYRISLGSTPPDEVVSRWKERFGEFWPKGNSFYGTLNIGPGDVRLLNVAVPGRMRLSTGIIVIYADQTSFSFMTPEGHMFSGMVTFSAESQDGQTVAQAQALIRAQDPLYEVALTFGGHRMEDKMWAHVLTSLAASFGVEAEVEFRRVCVDRRRQWSQARNIRHNAAIRSTAHTLTTPVRLLAKPLRARQRAD